MVQKHNINGKNIWTTDEQVFSDKTGESMGWAAWWKESEPTAYDYGNRVKEPPFFKTPEEAHQAALDAAL